MEHLEGNGNTSLQDRVRVILSYGRHKLAASWMILTCQIDRFSRREQKLQEVLILTLSPWGFLCSCMRLVTCNLLNGFMSMIRPISCNFS